jgi:hypothetical protein
MDTPIKKIRGPVPDRIEDMSAYREFPSAASSPPANHSVSDSSNSCVSDTGNNLVSER